MRIRAAESLLLVVLLAVVGFVGAQILESRDARPLEPPAPHLTTDDSLHVLHLYTMEVAAMGERYHPPAWVRALQLAHLQAAALREVSGDTLDEPAADALPVVRDSAGIVAFLARAEPATYLGAILEGNGGAVRRWTLRRAPILVWVEPGSREPGFDPGFVDPVRAAFRRWSAVVPGVTFDLVKDSTRADVLVTWSAHVAELGRLGTTFRVIDGAGRIVVAHVVLSSTADIFAVQNAALHEAGHVLGLEHSPNADDIMAASTAGKQFRLTDADRATARLLYRLPPGPVPVAHAARGGAGAP